MSTTWEEKKTRSLVCYSIYWVNINHGIENTIKNVLVCLDSQVTQPNVMKIYHEIPVIPPEAVGADVYTVNDKNYLCVVDYHTKFPMIKQIVGFSVENRVCQVS